MASRADLIAAFVAAGHQLWLVGGALRDELLGRPGVDADYATDALPDAVEAIALSLGLPVTAVGKRWGTIGVLVDGHWSEITTFRGDSYTGGTRWPDVTFGRSVEEDLARRDFTINAFARNAVTGEFLDRYGGSADLAAGVIRAVGVPAERFREDPLRILRGLRFASQLGFDIEPDTLAGMCATTDLLPSLSQERITAELDKLLAGADPARGLTLVLEAGALAQILPEFVSMQGCEQNSFHRFDVWGHTLATVAAIGGEPGPELRLRRWAALFHDVGKPGVRHRKPNGEWGFYRHESAGELLADAICHRLRLGRRESAAITLLVRRHMDRPNLDDRRSIRRFIVRLEGHWRDLVALKRADNASHTYDDSTYHDALDAICERVEAEDAIALRAQSPLSGDDLVALAGRPPGRWIAPIKERLSALVLDGELQPDDRGAATRIARRMLGGEENGATPRT